MVYHHNLTGSRLKWERNTFAFVNKCIVNSIRCSISLIRSSIRRVSGQIINRRMSRKRGKLEKCQYNTKGSEHEMMMCPFSSATRRGGGPVGKSEPVELDNPLLASLVDDQQQKSWASSSFYFHCYTKLLIQYYTLDAREEKSFFDPSCCDPIF